MTSCYSVDSWQPDDLVMDSAPSYSIYLKSVTEKEVIHNIRNLKVCAGINNLKADIMKHVAKVIAPPLSIVSGWVNYGHCTD